MIRCSADVDCLGTGALCYTNATWYKAYVNRSEALDFVLGQEGCFCNTRTHFVTDNEGRCTLMTLWSIPFLTFNLPVTLLALVMVARLVTCIRKHIRHSDKNRTMEFRYLKRATYACCGFVFLFVLVYTLGTISFIVPARHLGNVVRNSPEVGGRLLFTFNLQTFLLSPMVLSAICTATNLMRLWFATVKNFKELNFGENMSFKKREKRINFCLAAMEGGSLGISLIALAKPKMATVCLGALMIAFLFVAYIVSRDILGVLLTAKLSVSALQSTLAGGRQSVDQKKFSTAIRSIKMTSNAVMSLVSISLVANIAISVAIIGFGEKNLSAPGEPPVLQLLLVAQGWPLLIAALVASHYFVGLNRNVFKKEMTRRATRSSTARTSVFNIFGKTSHGSVTVSQTSVTNSSGRSSSASVTPH